MLREPSPARLARRVARDVDGGGGEFGVIAVAAPALPDAAVDRLPGGELGVPELDADPFWRLVAAFVDCGVRRPPRVLHRSTGLAAPAFLAPTPLELCRLVAMAGVAVRHEVRLVVQLGGGEVVEFLSYRRPVVDL